MTFEEEVRLGYLVYNKSIKLCSICEKPTEWVDINLYSRVCSKECEQKLIDEMSK